jgi:hypothetical protein
VLDELSREVSLLALKPCVNNKLQKPHASANMTFMRIRTIYSPLAKSHRKIHSPGAEE